MISLLRGTWCRPDWGNPAVVDGSGVGWHVQPVIEPVDGEVVELFIVAVYRDGEPSLYGFATTAEREVFLCLVKVQGVGPAVALSVLRALGAAGTVAAVRANQVKALTAVKGIGPAAAARICSTATFPEELCAGDLSDASTSERPDEDLVDTLVDLGFNASDARGVLAGQRASETSEPQSEDSRLAAAIKELGRRS
jgi:Holliday junction DNA helicase RuvA